VIEVPISDGFPYLNPRFLTDSGRKIQEYFSVCIYRASRPECVAKKIEMDAVIGDVAMILLTINNLRLFLIEFQLAFGEPFLYGSFYKLRLFLAYTVTYRIARVSLE
jgi:hypothetical protein